MKRFLVAFFILLLWFFGGSRVYLCSVKALCTENGSGKSTTDRIPPENPGVLNVTTVMASDDREQAAVAEDTTAGNRNGFAEPHKVIYFDFDSEQYRTDGALKEYIAALKTYLEAHPGKKISITGHTDNVGETADNEWIGMERAKSAMKYLVSRGISEERITLYSKGETEPIASNADGDGRKRNRRVEININ